MNMLDIAVDVDAAAIRDLSRAMNRMRTEFKKSSGDAVIWTSRVIAETGAAISKPGKKIRPIESRMAGRKKIWFVSKYGTQNRPQPRQVIVGVGKKPPVRGNAKLLKARTIKRHGLARKVWNSINGKIGNVRNGQMSGLRASKRYGKTVNAQGKVKKRVSKNDAEITLTNRLTYLEKVYPGIVTKLISKGSKTLEKRMDIAAERAAKKV
jgi:hypothetical protein